MSGLPVPSDLYKCEGMLFSVVHGRREGDSPPIAQMRPMATQISTDRGRYRCVSVSVGDAISAISGQDAGNYS